MSNDIGARAAGVVPLAASRKSPLAVSVEDLRGFVNRRAEEARVEWERSQT